jgi:hypothetical protein
MDPAGWFKAASLAGQYVDNMSASTHFPIKAVHTG